MAGKFYAVKKGKVPGIYTSWDACKSMVHGFPGAVYKGFATRAEAEQFLEEKKEEQKEPENYAFVDGSFNSATSVYGYGGFLVTKGERHVISGSGNDPQMASMRNVAGEVLGSMAAVKEAVAMGLTDLTIYYDYMGIEMWATGGWKAKNELTQKYAAFMKESGKTCEITFRKIAAHTGDTYNEEADQLAKAALLPDKDEE